MKLLVLGGTLFLGRHVVEAARARGHQVTLFNRGRTNPELYADLERLRGDREHDRSAWRGRTWDAVVDTSGYLPRIVEAGAAELASAAGRYLFVSSASVYASPLARGADESAAVAEIADADALEYRPENYGALKARCERAVETHFPGRALNVRLGLLVGPHDPTDRFTYWARRGTRGGELLAPGRPERRVQWIDARDAAEWMIAALEAARGGVYNLTGPCEPATMGDLIDQACRAGEASARVTWVDEEFLLQQGVQPWTELPLWLPEANNALLELDLSRARAAGLRTRDPLVTLRDTARWDAERWPDGAAAELASGVSTANGMAPERERELLATWHGRGQ